MHDQRSEIAFEGSARPVLAGLLAVQAFLGYEWLMSGLAKVLSGEFVSGLGDHFNETLDEASGFYKSFLETTVIPNAQLFGYLVTIGEVALGMGLIVAAATWWFRWSSLSLGGRSIVLGVVVLGGVIAIFMNVNFHLANGSSHPWLIAADPFDEGVDLDSVMPLIQLAISLVALTLLRRIRAARAEA
ncbi:MAG TPA: hypothetical protein VF494_04475 [Candidatus Limnocylindrales bacterium]